MVDGHQGDGVLGVGLQVLQDGGGGGSRHLVLVGGEEKGGFGERLETPYPGNEGLAEAGGFSAGRLNDVTV